mmetsp:Transcript_16977/g.34438  ORF Transcript_16977/g.34438 Transcript_16977/m.34438 type:complete len:457 (-) Transcript_16977:2024-3394(-)
MSWADRSASTSLPPISGLGSLTSAPDSPVPTTPSVPRACASAEWDSKSTRGSPDTNARQTLSGPPSLSSREPPRPSPPLASPHLPPPPLWLRPPPLLPPLLRPPLSPPLPPPQPLPPPLPPPPPPHPPPLQTPLLPPLPPLLPPPPPHPLPLLPPLPPPPQPHPLQPPLPPPLLALPPLPPLQPPPLPLRRLPPLLPCPPLSLEGSLSLLTTSLCPPLSLWRFQSPCHPPSSKPAALSNTTHREGISSAPLPSKSSSKPENLKKSPLTAHPPTVPASRQLTSPSLPASPPLSTALFSSTATATLFLTWPLSASPNPTAAVLVVWASTVPCMPERRFQSLTKGLRSTLSTAGLPPLSVDRRGAVGLSWSDRRMERSWLWETRVTSLKSGPSVLSGAASCFLLQHPPRTRVPPHPPVQCPLPQQLPLSRQASPPLLPRPPRQPHRQPRGRTGPMKTRM